MSVNILLVTSSYILLQNKKALFILKLRNWFEMLLYYIQFSIAQGTKSQCNKYCTHANVKAYRTIFVKLWKKLINFYKVFQHFPLLISVQWRPTKSVRGAKNARE